VKIMGSQDTGAVFFGEREFVIGISPDGELAQFARIDLVNVPVLAKTNDAERMEYELATNKLSVSWSRLGFSLTIREVLNRARVIDEGNEGPG
jgi:hypothetical protein